MDDLAQLFLTPSVLLYLAAVVGTQVLYSWWRRKQQARINTQRRTRGLPKEILLNHTERLAERRRVALTESALLLATVVILPFVLIAAAQFLGQSAESASSERAGLAITFVTLLLGILISSTNVLKAFLEGLAFKTLAAFTVPFQIGDRVTLKSISGKVIQLTTFFVVLETLKGERVSIPTHSLWNEVMTSVNGGDRASLCEMVFYLSPKATAEQWQAAENIIWDTIQSSVYFEPSKPIQIYLSQSAKAIELTARVYVASTYNEPLFASDVTRAFLDFAHAKQIPLGAE
ncbi:MAG: mechanosensitive ion channel domain-containing protein [Phormidesmis sp.]